MNKRAVVVGSINMDAVIRVDRHPRPGETLSGRGPDYYPGGKGANQAVAAARSGVGTAMLGAVGDDAHGDALLASLRGAGVDTAAVARLPGPSGMAFITVDEPGENTIIVCGNANAGMTPERVEARRDVLAGAGAVLLQNEIPEAANRRAMELAVSAGAAVFYNPAPARELADDLYPYITVLVVNESEAELLSGLRVSDRDAAVQAADVLLAKGAREVVVTLGPAGAVAARRGAEPLYVPAWRVTPVDTTAAGDTFIGALAARWLEGEPMARCLAFAAAAAALAVSRQGAQTSIPERAEVEAFMAAGGMSAD